MLTTPPYKNKKDYKGGTNDKTRDSHTRETIDYQSNNDGCAIKMDEEQQK